MEDFVSYDIAVKLKEKGFICKYPFAMYTEYEQFCPLYSSDKYYFGIDDFDKHDYIAPTISQVLKWLRNKRIDIVPMPLYPNNINERYRVVIWFKNLIAETVIHDKRFETWEQAAIAGIEYAIDNLI